MLKPWNRRRRPSLRDQLDDAQIGIVDAPQLDEDEPADTAASTLPRSPVDDEIVIGDGSPQQPKKPLDAHPLTGRRFDPPAATVDSSTVRAFIQSADGVIDALKSELGKVERERDALDAELRRTQRQLAEELERSMAEASPQPAPKGKSREVTDSLREANQRLRGLLRSETDRANRAESQLAAAQRRIAGLELTCQSLARANPGQESPDVVTVDGTDMVVPWSSRS